MKDLGRLLKYCRKFYKMTQGDLGLKLNLSRSYISEIESGKKLPTIETLQKYSEVFDIELSVLFLFSENLGNKTLKNKIKFFVRKKVLTLLDYIIKQ